MEDNNDTKKYIVAHIKKVQEWIFRFSEILWQRGVMHDDSKLKEPEFSQWCEHIMPA